ncbi:MAG TPA: hypothetical protein VF862_07915 [Gemmatimonadales bacterium]
MTTNIPSRRWAVLTLAIGALACDDPATSPAVALAPLFAIESAVQGDGAPFTDAQVLVGSYCKLGKRDKMEARLYWETGSDKVQSFLLWLERADGSQRQLTRKVLGSPRTSGVAAGFEYQSNGPWVKARLELYAGAPDYSAPKTTIEIDCGQ